MDRADNDAADLAEGASDAADDADDDADDDAADLGEDASDAQIMRALNYAANRHVLEVRSYRFIHAIFSIWFHFVRNWRIIRGHGRFQ